MRRTFLGLITALAISVLACGDDGTATNTAAVIGDVPAPGATDTPTQPPPPAPPGETGKPNTELPPSVPRPDPPCTHCPANNGVIITPSR